MKFYLFACAAVALPLAVAAAAETAVDGATLGQLDAIVAHCGQANPNDSARYQELLTPLIADVPPAQIEAARQTEAYLQAYAAISEQLEKASKDDVVAACAGAIASNN